MQDEEWISASTAAALLGVKPATLYAYVSRGLVTSHRRTGERSSVYDRREIETLSRHRGRRTLASALEWTVQSSLTLIQPDRLRYRGSDASGLAVGTPFEAVAALLWTGAPTTMSFNPDPAALPRIAAARAGLPSGARLVDQLALGVVVAGACDEFRVDLQAPAVIRAAATLIGTLVESLPCLGDAESFPHAAAGGRIDRSVAGRLWTRITSGPPPPGGIEALNAAMVLLADHELATSTLAARVAASTRADPYAVVTAAMATLSGPLHGSISVEVVALLEDASKIGDAAAVAQRLRRDGRVHGFGHRLYPAADPRAELILRLVLAAAERGSPAMAHKCNTVRGVQRVVADRFGVLPNSDFGLGAMVWLFDMASDAGEAIFALSRTAGWVGHALEEYQEAPHRFRGRSVYVGPEPDAV